MKSFYIPFFLFTACFMLASCGESTVSVSLDESPVVAKRVMVDGEELIDLDLSLLKDTLSFPLSHFTEEMQIIKLDEAEEALIGSGATLVSDNYILIRQYNIPIKLFTMQGKYLASIGGIGQGPGEYQFVCDMKIHEGKQRIYVLEYRGTAIKSYDFSGKYIESIPLARPQAKGKLIVYDDKILMLSQSYRDIEGDPIWMQDFEGNLLYDIESSRINFPTDYNNELYVDKVGDNLNYHFWIWKTFQDSLYHVDLAKKQLIPRFTATFTGEVKPHFYQELHHYFIGSNSAIVTESYQDEKGNMVRRVVGDPPGYYIVDKQTLKGSYFKIENDYFGNEVFSNPLFFTDGYFAANIDPGDLFDRIEVLLKKSDLSDAMRKKLSDIYDNISDNDNNYIFYAKLK